jgi:predicted SAM-dependent methyltransferase
MKKIYAQYGCGHAAHNEWINFDASPTLQLQLLPFVGLFIRPLLNTTFPKGVQYGNIIKGLPMEENSCDGLFCSHVLEHLSLDDFRKALKNSYKVLKPGGVFRLIVPDLEFAAKEYMEGLKNNDPQASIKFLGENTLVGTQNRPNTFKGKISSLFGNSNHLWMWDTVSLKNELTEAGFSNIRQCFFHDSEDEMFSKVETESRYENAIAFECQK